MPQRLRDNQAEPAAPFVVSDAARGAIAVGDIASAVRRHVGAAERGGRCESGASRAPLIGNARVLSAFRDRRGTAFWILTEADGESTAIILPEEF